MHIELRLYFTYKGPASQGPEPSYVEVAEGSSLGDLMAELGIEHTPDLVTLLNGRPAQPDDPLAPDAVVTIFPPVGGG